MNQPGQKILEAGAGHGALATYLSRAVGPTGRVISLENRYKAWKALQQTLPEYYARYVLPHEEASETTSGADVLPPESSVFTVGNISCYYGSIDDRDGSLLWEDDQTSEGRDTESTRPSHAHKLFPSEATFDGIAIDVMEPWTCLQTVSGLLVDDGAIVCFCPNVTQVGIQAYIADCPRKTKVNSVLS